MDTLTEYIEQIIDPTFADFESDPSRRMAFITAIVIFHAIDRAASDKGMRSSGNLRKAWGKASMAFKIVDIAAHRFKHVTNGEDNIAPGQWGSFKFGWVMQRMTMYEFTFTMKRAIQSVKKEAAASTMLLLQGIVE